MASNAPANSRASALSPAPLPGAEDAHQVGRRRVGAAPHLGCLCQCVQQPGHLPLRALDLRVQHLQQRQRRPDALQGRLPGTRRQDQSFLTEESNHPVRGDAGHPVTLQQLRPGGAPHLVRRLRRRRLRPDLQEQGLPQVLRLARNLEQRGEVVHQDVPDPLTLPRPFPDQLVRRPRPLAQPRDQRRRQLHATQHRTVGHHRLRQPPCVPLVVLVPRVRRELPEMADLPRVDRVHAKTRRQQRRHHRPVRPLDPHRHQGRSNPRLLLEPLHQGPQPRTRVRKGAAPPLPPRSVQYADLVLRLAPVNPHEPRTSRFHRRCPL